MHWLVVLVLCSSGLAGRAAAHMTADDLLRRGAQAAGSRQVDAARESFRAALALADATGDKTAQGRAHGSLGSLLARTGGDKLAVLEHYAQATQLFESVGDHGRAASACLVPRDAT